MRHHACAAIAILLAFAPSLSLAAPDPLPTGLWNRDDGLGGISITSCGDALCGHIVWLRDRGTPASVGQEVLFGMHRTSGDTWEGSANNPEDGQTYAGSMRLDGSRLLTKGCVMAGLICRSVALSRPR